MASSKKPKSNVQKSVLLKPVSYKKGSKSSEKVSKKVHVKSESVGVASSEIVEISEIKNEKKTTEYMSVYEYTALIRARALQLGMPGVFPAVEIDFNKPEEFDPINIATKEVMLCLTTLIIRRTLTDGTTEDWYPKDMVFPKV